MKYLQLFRFLLAAAMMTTVIGNCANAQDSEPASNGLQPPEDMALIPAGPFLMGNNNDFHDNDFDERPRHAVNLPPFYMDIFPVTNQDYKVFIDATGHRIPQYWPDTGEIPASKEKHPVTGISFPDATAFAAWKGHRLPTEQEWEKAARGAKGLRWPWGNTFDKKKANVGLRTTTPVGAYPEGCNAYGLCDMAGNVWEWTSTWYAPYPDAPPNRAILRFLNDQYLSVRGGSSASDIGSARGADRGIKKPLEPGPALGFRTVLDVPGYAGYRDALRTIELARETLQAAGLDITQYDEHADARDLLAKAKMDLANAGKIFGEKRFIDSAIMAQHSISKAGKAQQIALDVRRDYQEKRRTQTADVLGRLEMALEKLPNKQTPDRQAAAEQATNHLRLGRQLEAEGGWGYAQMHGYIGLKILANLPP